MSKKLIFLVSGVCQPILSEFHFFHIVICIGRTNTNSEVNSKVELVVSIFEATGFPIMIAIDFRTTGPTVNIMFNVLSCESPPKFNTPDCY